MPSSFICYQLRFILNRYSQPWGELTSVEIWRTRGLTKIRGRAAWPPPSPQAPRTYTSTVLYGVVLILGEAEEV